MPWFFFVEFAQLRAVAAQLDWLWVEDKDKNRLPTSKDCEYPRPPTAIPQLLYPGSTPLQRFFPQEGAAFDKAAKGA